MTKHDETEELEDLEENVIMQVTPDCPQSVIDIIVRKLQIIKRASARVDEEGIVVRDLKGSVVAHPAIKIETESMTIVSGLLKTYKRAKRIG